MKILTTIVKNKNTKVGKLPHVSRAFSIVETLVAISILVLSVTGPMVFAQTSLRAATFSRDQVTAFFLAQDAIEFIKHIRDENSLNKLRNEWLDGLGDCMGQECMISSADGLIGSDYGQPCTPPDFNDCRLKIDSSSLLYGLTGDDSKFIRTVRIEPPPVSINGVNANPADEARIIVNVSWQTHPLLPIRNVEVIEDITNWVQ